MRPSFFQHLHSPTIPKRQARFRYTLGAGGISVFLVLVLLVTGILEVFYYIPTTDQAPASVQTLTYLVPFGGLIRNLHYWAAQALVVLALLHLLRVLLTGSYLPPRRFNYLLGICLFLTILFLDFSGYLLRWDEGVRWPLVIGTNLLKTIPLIGDSLYLLVAGGPGLGEAVLLRFYAWHVFGLIIFTIIFGVWHIFRVRRDGGITAPPPDHRESRERIPREELVRKEVLAILVVSGLLLLLSIFLPAPIDAPIAEAASSTDYSRAPWFFLWVQYFLRFGDPFLMGVLLPLGFLLFLVLIPFLPSGIKPEDYGRWFPKGARGVQCLAIGMTILVILFSILALFPPAGLA